MGKSEPEMIEFSVELTFIPDFGTVVVTDHDKQLTAAAAESAKQAEKSAAAAAESAKQALDASNNIADNAKLASDSAASATASASAASGSASSAAKSASDASSSARAAAVTATTAAESAKIASEKADAAAASATGASTSASAAAESAEAAENNAKAAESSAKSAVNDARSSADNAAAAAQSASDAANSAKGIDDKLIEAAQSASDAAASAETAKKNAELVDGDAIQASINTKGDNLWFNGEDKKLYLTSNGEPIGDGVTVATSGGGGGSSGPVVTVRLKNETGTSAMSLAEGSDVELKFNFTSTEDGEPTGNATCEVSVNGAVKTSMGIAQGSHTVNVKDYLTAGTNTVKITCTDAYDNRRSLTFTITIVSLNITSTFDDSLIYDGEITFKYTPFGVVEKTIHYIVDGAETDAEVITASGKQTTKMFPAMPHGSHTLKVYATAMLDGVSVTSNTLSYDIICVEAGKTDVIIASVFDKTEATQGDLLEIPFMVYDPSNQTASVTLTIKTGSTTYSTQSRTVGRTKELWSTRQYPAGSVSFVISCGSASKTYTLTIAADTMDVQAVTNDSELHLSSAGRSNSESARDTWADGLVTTKFSNVNWDTTGWVADSNGDTALRLFGSATAEIGFKPFATDFRTYGKTIEIEFSVRDVNNRDAVVLSCMDNGIGIEITADRAVLHSEQSEIECRFTDEEKLRVAFTVAARSEYRLMSIYLNGILSGACQYPDNDNFQQAKPVNITVGSPYCGIDLYIIRAYSTALSYSEIRDNYIADTTDTAKKRELYNANNIYDDYGNLSYEAVKTKIPVMTIIGDLPTAKGDKKKVRIKYEDPFRPTLNFDSANDAGDCTIDVQGTSSQWYVRKNWKLKFKSEHTHAEGMLPAKVFCMKADYAEATGTHNTQNANLVGTLYTTKTPPQEVDDRIRTTVYGFPCVIYHQQTENDTPEFNGKYNFNYDKGAENVYGFTSDYPSAESWEFGNNTSDDCLFHAPLSDNWSDNFEARYPEDYMDISHFKVMHDWVVSTYQDAATGAALAESYTDSDGTVHTVDNAAYRLAKFKTEFAQHFNLSFCLLYYVYTFVMLMVDQRAKNMFLTTWDGIHWEPWLYDNDTCLGINNEGALVFDYYHEDIDQLAGANVYNGQTSTLWVNFKAVYAGEIMDFYQQLRKDGKLTPDIIYQYFITNGAKKWSESIYNEDAVFKYISMLISDGDASNLPQIRGSGESHLRYFVDNRIRYCDSKWYAPDYANDYISLRIYTPVDANGAVKTGLAVPASANITVTPFSDMYAGVRYKANGTLMQQRATKNKAVTFTAPNETFNDTETAIYGASQLSSVGDLAPLYCGSVNVANAGKLTTLKIGSSRSGYSNTNLTSLSVGTNELLKSIDVRNCPNLTQPLGLSNCPNIEEIYADGSAITGVELADSGYVRIISLPETITNLTMRNQMHIESFTCAGYANLTTLRIENSVNIPVETIVKNAPKLNRVRLLDIDITCDDVGLLNLLMSCGGLDEAGNNTNKSIVTGKIHVKVLSKTDLARINAYYPNLTVTYDTSAYVVTFAAEDGSVLDTQAVVEGGDAVDPVENGRIPTPTKASTAQYIYTFSGWSGAFTNITKDTTVTAQFQQNTRTYTIRFLAEDGSVLQSSRFAYGSTPEYNGTAPTSNVAGAKWTGWTPDIAPVTQDVDYRAAFTVTRYTVKFVAEDGSTLDTQSVVEGGDAVDPVASGRISTPTKASTAQYSYTFSGWSGSLTNITKDTTVTAQFRQATRTYTIRFLGEDGSVLQSSKLAYGATPEYTGAAPTSTVTGAKWTGWAPDIVTVTQNADYKAVFKVTTYTVTFKNFDGSVLDTQSVVEGEDAADPVASGRISTPTRPSTAQYSYTFSGWSGSFTNVTQSLTITAMYTQAERSYTIRFLNGSTVLQSTMEKYGAMPAYKGDNPTQSGVIWTGWTPEISAVTQNVDYKATFEAIRVPDAVKSLADCSWPEIKALADNGYKNAKNQWCYKRGDNEEVWFSIGDEKTVKFLSGEEVVFQIYDFQHDDKSNGTKAAFTFGMKNLLATSYRMNESRTNEGSWKATEMRNKTLPMLLQQMPVALQQFIVEVIKKTVTQYGSADLTDTLDKLFLFSYPEIGIYDKYYAENHGGEGTMYPIFTTSASRVKDKVKGGSYSWWGRSPYSTGYFLEFWHNGNDVGYRLADKVNGVCFGFCI